MSDIYLLIGTTDIGDPNVTHFASLEEFGEYALEHSLDPDDPRHLLIHDMKIVNWKIPRPTIEIVGANSAAPKAKRKRRTREEIEAARAKGETVPGRKPKANGADTTAVVS